MAGLGWQESVIIVVTAILSIVWQIAIVVVGVTVAWRWLNRREGSAARLSASQARTAIEMLDERFARGEIDAQEYRERRELLRAGTP